MSCNGPIFELIDASYQVNGVPLVKHARWAVRPGEHWAVLGPNGSGKTTLLRLACGFLWPTAGSVKRLGKQRIDLGHLRRRIGWISAELLTRMPPRQPALDIVVAGRFAQIGLKHLPSTIPTAEDYQRARDGLAQLGASEIADKPFGVLSQGEKQKVLIARAAMAEPLLLVLDEPCAGMDPGARERLLAALNQLAADPAAPTLVMVTHHIAEILPALRQTLIMADGEVAAHGPTEQVLTAETITQVYGVGLRDLVVSGGRYWPIWE